MGGKEKEITQETLKIRTKHNQIKQGNSHHFVASNRIEVSIFPQQFVWNYDTFQPSIWSIHSRGKNLYNIQSRKTTEQKGYEADQSTVLLQKKGVFKSQTSAFHYSNLQGFSFNFCINEYVWVTLIYSNLTMLLEPDII